MQLLETKALSNSQKEAIYILWNEEFPSNLKHEGVESFQAYLDKLTEHHYVLALDQGNIVGWYFEFNRDNERWFSMLLSKHVHGQGHGSRLLSRAKERVKELNGWVIDHERYKKSNGDVYHSPVGFYKKNGFTVLPDIRIETERLSAVKIQWKA